MEISFKNRKLQNQLQDDAERRKQYGVDMAKKILQRLVLLREAVSLADLWPPKSLPERCHELQGDLAGTFSIDVRQPYRLLFARFART
jgi:plasmid maintenance system killer protein